MPTTAMVAAIRGGRTTATMQRMHKQGRAVRPVLSAMMAGRRRMHVGDSPSASIANENARKHGGYSANTMAAVRFVKAMARLVSDDLP